MKKTKCITCKIWFLVIKVLELVQQIQWTELEWKIHQEFLKMTISLKITMKMSTMNLSTTKRVCQSLQEDSYLTVIVLLTKILLITFPKWIHLKKFNKCFHLRTRSISNLISTIRINYLILNQSLKSNQGNLEQTISMVCLIWVEVQSDPKLQIWRFLKSLVRTYSLNICLGPEDTPARKRPLVFIDVNLGKEKGKQKLVVYD